jgi:hypothetical protein
MASVSILSYLRYLHDVNRKLLQRGGLENVLFRKPARQAPFYHQLDQPDSGRPRHWLQALRHIQNAELRGTPLRPLLGLGLVVGQAETAKGNKRLTAPLAFCNVRLIEDEEKPNLVSMESLWESATLNYDLLTFLLGQLQTDENEDTAPLPQVGVGGSTLSVFTTVENDLEKLANDSNPDARFTPAAMAKLMKFIVDNVPEFRCIRISNNPYDHKMLDGLVQQRPAAFFSHRFFFVAAAAGELTTMTALATLIRQTERSQRNAI